MGVYVNKTVSQAVLALGANLRLRGNSPEVTLRNALDTLSEYGVLIRAVSRFFETPCFPAGAGPDYVNAAALVEMHGQPDDLLATLHRVEHAFGRERKQRWGMRTLDLDLICWGEHVLPNVAVHEEWRHLSAEKQGQLAPSELILPHPRLQDRAFVLVPMADVAPDWRHPLTGLTVQEMIARLPASDVAAVTPL